MRKTILTLACLIIFTASSLALTGEKRTIRGKFIDIRCYVDHKGGQDEVCRQCVIACFKADNPGGILEEGSGKIYLVVSDDRKLNLNDTLMPYFTKRIEIKGVVKERGGVSTITIEEIKEISYAPAKIEKKGPTLAGERKG